MRKAYIGWAVLAVILFAMADVPTTSELAVSFSLLILITTLLVVGPTAFDNVTKLVNGAAS